MKEYPFISPLKEWAGRAIKAIDAYNKSFDKQSLLKMTITEDEIKAIHKSYRVLTTELVCIKDGSAPIAAEIAKELCSADMEMDAEKTACLSLILESYIKWSNAVSAFIDASDRLFARKDKNFRVSDALSLSTVLRNATEKMKGDLQNEKLYPRA